MRRYNLEVGASRYVIDVDEITTDRYRVLVGDAEYEVRLAGDEELAEGEITPAMALPRSGAPRPAAPAAPLPRPEAPPARTPSAPRPAPAGAPGLLTAPMPGKILAVGAACGDRVQRGQTLLTLEAMKMKNALKAPCDGVVREVLVREEQTVAHGDPLLRLERQ
jgi:biotin carboxyl carrier protein